MRDGGAGLLPLLCAAAFGRALAGGPGGSADARMGVLASVGAEVLAPVLEKAASLTRRQWAGYAGTQPFEQACRELARSS